MTGTNFVRYRFLCEGNPPVDYQHKWPVIYLDYAFAVSPDTLFNSRMVGEMRRLNAHVRFDEVSCRDLKGWYRRECPCIGPLLVHFRQFTRMHVLCSWRPVNGRFRRVPVYAWGCDAQNDAYWIIKWLASGDMLTYCFPWSESGKQPIQNHFPEAGICMTACFQDKLLPSLIYKIKQIIHCPLGDWVVV